MGKRKSIYILYKKLLDETSLHIVGIEVEIHATSHVIVDTRGVANHAVSVDAERGGRSVEPWSPETDCLVNEDVGDPDQVGHAGVEGDEGFVQQVKASR